MGKLHTATVAIETPEGWVVIGARLLAPPTPSLWINPIPICTPFRNHMTACGTTVESPLVQVGQETFRSRLKVDLKMVQSWPRVRPKSIPKMIPSLLKVGSLSTPS